MIFVGSTFAVLGRVALSLFFILSGFNKIIEPGSTNEAIATNPYLQSMASTPVGQAVGAFELVAGLFILVGFLTRITSLVLAAYCVLVALFFYNELSDAGQQQLFLQYIAIAGGFLMLVAYGTTRNSLDGYRNTRREKTVVRERVVPIDRNGDGVADDRVTTDRVTTDRKVRD